MDTNSVSAPDKKTRSLRTLGSEVLVLVLSAYVYSLAFPGFTVPGGLPFIALFALVPVFAVIRNTRWTNVWWYGFLFGFVFYIFFAYWLKTFHALAIILIPVIKAFEMMLCFVALKAADRFFKRFGYIVEAIIWVAYAYLSENWFAGFSYGDIAYAFYSWPIVMQIADITGIWGVVFAAVLIQPFLGRYLSDWVNGKEGSLKAYLKRSLWFIVVWALVLVLLCVYGGVKLAEWSGRTPDDYLEAVAVQHNRDSWKGGYTTYVHNFNNLRRITLEAMDRATPDLVVWSETAFVPSVAWHTQYSVKGSGYEEIAKLVDDFVDFGNNLRLPLLTGNPEGVLKDPSLPALLEDGSQNREDYNTVILFDEGQIKQTYRKQHLVPFTEYFPYEKELPALYNILLANDYNWWLQGDEPVVFESAGVKFSTPICFEDTFGYLSAEFVKNGAAVIINMSNDSWSQKVSAELQHAAMGAVRAIETRKSVLRSSNSGISTLITPDGVMHEKMVPFTMGWHQYSVPVFRHENYPDTFYVEHIDLFAHIAVWLSEALLAIGLVLFIIEKAKSRKK